MYFEKVCEELCPFPQDEYKLLFIFFQKKNKTKQNIHSIYTHRKPSQCSCRPQANQKPLLSSTNITSHSLMSLIDQSGSL